MKVIRNVSYLFTHVHLVIDGVREYLDGAIAVHEGKIHVVLPQSDRLYSKWNHFRKINLHNAIIQASYVVPYYHEKEIPSFSERIKAGIGAYFVMVEKNSSYDYQQEEDCLGIYLRDEYSLEELKEKIASSSKIVAYLASEISEEKKTLLAEKKIQLLPEDSFFLQPQNNIWETLAQEEKIKCFSLDAQQEAFFRVLRQSSSRFSLWANPDKEGTYRSLAQLKEWGYPTRDLASMSVYNLLSFFEKNQERGELHRGKRADLVCVNQKREVLFMIKGGDLYR